MAAPTETQTLIVGAGAAGLAVARCLDELGLDSVVLEQRPHVGDLWRNAYERLHLHTPRSISGLPHQPMPRSFPRYPARLQMIDYLEHYARQLRRSPLFNRQAMSIRRRDGRWLTQTAGEAFASDNLVIATGNARKPVSPRWEGMEAYRGRVLHASEYRTGRAFRGQNVLVVGFGNSACEIAIDLHEHGALPSMSVRGAVNVIPRDVFGIPVVGLGILEAALPPRVADFVNTPIVRLLIGDISRYGLRRLPQGATRQIRERQQIPLVDIGTIALIRGGMVTVRPGIARFSETGVTFVDSVSGDFDAVILGTGYRAALGELLGGADGVLDRDGTPLVSGAPTAQPGLLFCGFEVVPSGVLRQIGIEARRIARFIAAG